MGRTLTTQAGPRTDQHMKEFLLQNPKGVSWSFCVRLIGVEDAFSDGQADWDGLLPDPHFIRHGTLLTRDWKIDFRSDPQKPLLMGDNVTFELADDGTEGVFHLFAPRYYGVRTRLTADVAVTDTEVFMDTDGLSVGDYLYFGTQETMRVSTVVDSESVTVTRGKFGTRTRRFDFSGLGMQITTNPVDFPNRIVEVFAAPVDLASHTLDTEHIFPIWAGCMKNPSTAEGRVKIEAAPLQALIESSWPGRLSTGKLGSGGQLLQLTEAHFTQGIKVWYRNRTGSSAMSGLESLVLTPGMYDESGTFAAVTPVDAMVPLSWAVKVLQDTLSNLLATNTSAPWRQTGVNVWENRLQFSLHREPDGKVSLRYTIMPVAGLEDLFPIIEISGMNLEYFTLQPSGRDVPVRYFSGQVSIKAEDTTIPLLLDDSAILPGEGVWSLPDDSDVRGLIRVSDGSNVELISFSGVSTEFNLTPNANEPRMIMLTGVKRGVGGTAARYWGEFPDRYEAGSADATFQELLYAADDLSDIANADVMDPDAIITAILLSAEDDEDYVEYKRGSTGLITGACRFVGYRMGLGIPKRFVDYEGIVRTMRRNGAAEAIGAWWVDEAGKGKEALEELLRLYGMFFVSKQFVRDGVLYFGISLESISPSTATTFDDIVDDADRAAGTIPTTEVNDRLVVNIVSLLPWNKAAQGNKSDAEPIIIYNEPSIAAVGPSKTLELKPNVFDWFSRTDGIMTNLAGREAHIAVALRAADRWIAAYGSGPYVLKLSVPAPVGWRFYAGDRLLITLTGVRDPAGNANIAATPGRISRVSHQWGSRARSEIEVYVGFESSAELAPNCLVTDIITSSTLGVSHGHFTTDDSADEFSDAAFFDPEDYDGAIYCQLWPESARYGTSTVIDVVVVARSGDVLTLETPLTPFEEADLHNYLDNGVPLVLSFGAYSSGSSSRQKAYAHMASSVTKKLDTTDSPKEYL